MSDWSRKFGMGPGEITRLAAERGITRSRMWQIIAQNQGYCIQCGLPRTGERSLSMCDRCAELALQARRRYLARKLEAA